MRRQTYFNFGVFLFFLFFWGGGRGIVRCPMFQATQLLLKDARTLAKMLKKKKKEKKKRKRKKKKKKKTKKTKNKKNFAPGAFDENATWTKRVLQNL